MSSSVRSAPAGRSKSAVQSDPLDRKVQIVLEGLRGDRPIREICREAGISVAAYYSWRDRFINAGRDGLAHPESERQALEERLRQLEAENAILRVEKDIFQDVCLAD